MLWLFTTVGFAVAFAATFARHALCNRRKERAVEDDAQKITVSDLYVYPVKSCKGLRVTEAKITPRGFAHDRLFMIIDRTGRCVTQRTLPLMALISPTVSDDGSQLTLTAPGMDEIKVNVATDGERKDFVVFTDTGQAIDQGEDVAFWISTYLDQPGLRLVRMPDDFIRLADEARRYIKKGHYQLSFTNGLQYLLTTRESQNDLSAEVGYEIPANRFRPNIVVSGTSRPFDEDNWGSISIGGTKFEVIQMCNRCKMPTVNQETGEFSPDKQPTATLRQHRKFGSMVMFGQLLVALSSSGEVRVGDMVKITERTKSPRICFL